MIITLYNLRPCSIYNDNGATHVNLSEDGGGIQNVQAGFEVVCYT